MLVAVLVNLVVGHGEGVAVAWSSNGRSIGVRSRDHQVSAARIFGTPLILGATYGGFLFGLLLAFVVGVPMWALYWGYRWLLTRKRGRRALPLTEKQKATRDFLAKYAVH